MKIMDNPEFTAIAPGPTIEAFENLDIDPAQFDHTAHLYVAWSYLQTNELLTSIARYRKTLRRLTEKIGVPEKYHETITWFFLIAVAERTGRTTQGDWDAFAKNNSDLFTRHPSLVRRFYSAEQLNSDLARKMFVLPDLKSST